MIVTLVLTIAWFWLVYNLYQSGVLKPSGKEIKKEIRHAIYFPKKGKSPQVLIAFLLLQILPLFWGLSFLLKSDANVLVVIGFFIWVYNWIKFIFAVEEEKQG